MGTDIHTAVEVRTKTQVQPGRYANGWVFAGEVFDSSWDFNYVPATEEVLSGLRDDQLLDALDFYVLDTQYGKLREHLSDEIVAKFKLFETERDADRAQIARKRDEVSNRPEGWDYSLVKEFEDQLARIRMTNYEETFTPEERRELIDAAVKYFKRENEDEDYDDPTPISLSRRQDEPKFKTAEPFDCRNYDLFAALAGVRNGRGFAGVYTGEPIKPIAEPRGIPEDADPDTLKELSHEHTPSWLTLAEMLNYDWDQPKTSGGIVSAEDYELLKEINPDNLYPWSDEAEKRSGRGMSVSGGISGMGIRVFEPKAYERWKEEGKPRPDGMLDDPYGHEIRYEAETGEKPEIKPFVSIRWIVPLRESISDEFWTGLEAMKELIPPGGTEGDVRLVFDFDS